MFFAKSSACQKKFTSDLTFNKPSASVKIKICFAALYTAGIPYTATAAFKTCRRAQVKHLIYIKFSSVLPYYYFRNYNPKGIEAGFHTDVGFHMDLIRGKFVYIIAFRTHICLLYKFSAVQMSISFCSRP